MVLVGGAGVAAAGEVTGNGKPITIKAKSLCAFSGLEDWVSAEEQPPGGLDVHPGTVQNWGHVKHALGLKGGANSVQTPFGEEGCNAHLYPAR
jgi:hypothetical protein